MKTLITQILKEQIYQQMFNNLHIQLMIMYLHQLHLQHHGDRQFDRLGAVQRDSQLYAGYRRAGADPGSGHPGQCDGWYGV